MIRVTRSSKRLKDSVEEENHSKNQPYNAKRAKIVTENCEKNSAGKIRGAASKSKVIGGNGKSECLSLVLNNMKEKQEKGLNSKGESPAQKTNNKKDSASDNQRLQKLDSDLDSQLNKVKSKAVRNNAENKRKFGKDIKNVSVAGLPRQSETTAAKNIDFSISSIAGTDRFKLTTSTPVVLLKRLERNSVSKPLFNSEPLDLPDFPQFLSPVLSEEQRTMSIKAAGGEKCILNFDENEGNKADGEKSSKDVKLKSNNLMARQQKLTKDMIVKIDSKSCSNSKKSDKPFSNDDDDFQGAQNKCTKKTYKKTDNVADKNKAEGNVVQGNKSFKLFDSSLNQEKVTKKEVITKKQRDVIKKTESKNKKVQDKISLKRTGDPPASGKAKSKQTKSNVQENDWLPQTMKRMEEIKYIDENYSLIIE